MSQGGTWCLRNAFIWMESKTRKQRYTRDIIDYELTLPHRISASGEFISFSLPQYFTHKFERRKREVNPEDKLYYSIIFNGRDHHIELWPNHGFVSPNLVKEWYTGHTPVQSRRLQPFGNQLCHFIGFIKGEKKYSAALSLCDGLAGYFMTDKGQYYIEPIADHQPNANGEHVHVIYKRKMDTPEINELKGNPNRCGVQVKWTDAWIDQMKKTAKRKDVVRHAAGHSKHRYLELLVVADKKFIDYHQKENVENYILTIMNMVSNYYHDSSAGNLLDVVVVRVIYLEKPDEHLDLEISKNAEVTLDSFCAWAKTVNPTDVNNPQHHDIAVLLTRHDLCSDNVTECSLMGLAFLATACDPDKACAINEDSGLALGITVTHEVGHVMGCGHDNGEDSPCSPQNDAGEYFIMSPYVHMQTTQWSPCSRKFMTELFENQLGECLNDAPQVSLYKSDAEIPPGSVYDADYQCNIAYPGSTHCVLEQGKICERLFCKEKGAANCVSNGEPPADGTKCGENMWCFNSKCVEIGQRPESVDGGWGDWGEWSECSRSCGGGVSVSERDCNNPAPSNRGLYCLGERKRVKICNTDSCPVGGQTFRQQQCQEYDKKPFKNQLHKWKPFFKPDNPCELNCIHEGNVYVALAPRVKDGTSCKPGTRNKCIFGVCRKIGCDWVIDSSAVDDICGVCNGDGSHCTIVQKTYTDVGRGYQKVVLFPAGSRNIQVHEMEASENTLAISAEDGTTFLLNGNFSEEMNGDKDFLGVPGIYDHPSVDKETLFIAGPLIKPIMLHVVFYTTNNPGVEYKYAEPSRGPAVIPKNPENGTAPSGKTEYHWEFLEFGECSARCGPGIKTAEAACTEKKAGKVGDKYCEKLPKPPPKTMDCNLRPCHTEWHPRIWGHCSACKGKSGTHTRIVDCVRENPEAGKDPIIVDDSLCKSKGTKPATSEICCSDEPCKTTRSTNELEDKIAGLWHQLNAVKKRGSGHKDGLKETEKKVLPSSEINQQGKESNVKKYLVVPQLTKKRFDGDVAQNNKYRKIYTIGKRNAENLDDPNKKRSTNSTAPCKGKAVTDRVPPEGNKLIEVPMKMSHEDVKLSDAAFETEGDKVADTLDFCNAKIFNGKQADEEMKHIKANSTACD